MKKTNNKLDSFELVLPKLVKIPLFADFDPENEEDKRILKLVYENLSVEKFKSGQAIIKEGEAGDVFYILYSGEVLITRKTPAGDTIALATLNSSMNVFFGEMAIINNDVRSATVTAKTECTTLVLEGKKFLDSCEKEPVLGYRSLLVLSKRLIKTIQDLNKDKVVLYEALCNEIEIGL